MQTSLCLVLVVAVASQGPAFDPSLPTRDEAVELLDTATKGIWSFDVYLSVKRRVLLKQERVDDVDATGESSADKGARDPRGIRRGRVQYRKFHPGETPPVEQEAFYRQVYAPPLKRCIENLDGPAGQATAMQVFDGEIRRILIPNDSSGSIRPPHSQIVPVAEDYWCSFRNGWGMEVLADRLRERSTTHVERDSKRPGLLVLDGPPDDSAVFLKKIGLRAWLDPDRGMLPAVIEVYRLNDEAQEVVGTRRTIEHAEVRPGLLAPVRMIAHEIVRDGSLAGEPSYEVETVVDVERSRWNVELDENVFAIQFPVGTYISDFVRDIQFVTGESEPNANLDELLRNAQKITGPNAAQYMTNLAGLESQRGGTRVWLLVVGNIAALLVIVAILAWRKLQKAGKK
jgi:hypothetical protein